MHPEGEELVEQERLIRVKILEDLVEKARYGEYGIVTPDCIGVHATSIEAFDHFVKTGKFSGYSETPYENPDFPQEGDLYFFPFNSSFPDHPGIEEFMSPEESVETAIAIADNRSKVHRLLTSLGLPLHPGGSLEYAYQLFPDFPYAPPPPDSPDYPDYTALMSLRPRGEMERLIAEAKKAQGVLVGISNKVLIHGTPRLGDSYSDLRIDIRQTPPRQAFSGIRPVGSLETAYFKSLGKKPV